jgi:hypothetical protein
MMGMVQRHCGGERQKQIPCGGDNQKGNNKTKADPYGMTTKKDKDKDRGDIDWNAIEMKFSFCSLLTEGVVYERRQGSDQGEEPGCSCVVGG